MKAYRIVDRSNNLLLLSTIQFPFSIFEAAVGRLDTLPQLKSAYGRFENERGTGRPSSGIDARR